MTSLASRIRGITYILLSITVFFSVLGFFTYYQVKQNEEYQHRLQFRELKAVSTDIANGAAQLREAISSYVGREKIVDGENLFSSATGALKKGVLYANHQACSYHSNVVAPVVCLARGGANNSNSYVATINSASGEAFRISVPLQNLITTAIKKHAVILLIDDTGKVLLRKENVTRDAALASQNLHHLNDILSISNATSFGHSGFVDQTLAGKDYRFYYMPMNELADVKLDTNRKQLIVVGGVSLSQLEREKFQIPNTVAAFVLLFIFILVSLLPLLKIRLISPAQSLTTTDRKLAVYGALMFIAFSTVFVIFTLGAYAEVDKVEEEGEGIALQMRLAFEKELKETLAVANDFIDKERTALLSNSFTDNLIYNDNILTSNQNRDVWLENVFVLRTQGEHAGLMRSVFWSDRTFFRNQKCARTTDASICHVEKQNAISLAGREYYTRAKNCELWPLEERLNASQRLKSMASEQCRGLFLQRIFNKRDSRLSTQFSTVFSTSELMENKDTRALYKSSSVSEGVQKQLNKLQPLLLLVHSMAKALGLPEAPSENHVVSFGTKFRTFFDPVLTPGYKFAVFDNNSGQVLFHTDESRVLNENIFVQTDNNPTLVELAEKQDGQPRAFTSVYRGKEHVMVVTSLAKSLPWTLVIMHDLSNQRALFFLRMFTIVAYFLVAMLFIIFIWEVLQACYQRHHQGLLFETKLQLVRKLGFGEFRSSAYSNMFVFTAGVAVVVVVTVLYYGSSMQYVSALSQIFASGAEQNRQLSESKILAYKQQMFGVRAGQFSERPRVFSMSFPNDEVPKCDVIESEWKSPELWQGTAVFSPPVFFSLFSFSQTRVALYEKLKALELMEDISNGDTEVEHKKSAQKQNTVCSFSVMAFGKGEANTLLYISLALLSGAVVLFGSSPLVHHLLFRRVLGLHIPPHFRTKMPENGRTKPGRLVLAIRQATSAFSMDREEKSIVDYRCHVITAARAVLKKQGDERSIQQEIDEYTVNAWLATLPDYPLNEMSAAFTLVLYGIDDIVFNTEQRLQVLALLRGLVAHSQARIVIECEIAPLYRLTNQPVYCDDVQASSKAAADETYGWSALFAKFEKHYAWNTIEKCRARRKDDVWHAVEHESKGWVELADITQRFYEYIVACYGPCPYENEKDKLIWVKSKVQSHWQPDEVVEFFSAEAGALYLQRWALCTKHEKLLLYQVARGDQPNPANRIPLEHLLRRGYLHRDANYFVLNESFRHFVLSAEPPEKMKAWLANAQDNTWRYFRVPLFAIIITGFAVMAYVATDSIQTFLAVLSAVLGILPMALSNFSALKNAAGGGSGE